MSVKGQLAQVAPIIFTLKEQTVCKTCLVHVIITKLLVRKLLQFTTLRVLPVFLRSQDHFEYLFAQYLARSVLVHNLKLIE
jgi:hypothetical protein